MMKSKRNYSLIIGFGEIGSSLFKVVNKYYPTDIVDFEKSDDIPEDNKYKQKRKYDVVHICIPHNDKFIEIVQEYAKNIKGNPDFVIHSTVNPGTTGALIESGVRAYHSPVRGVHPNLAQGIKTFVKYIAPRSDYLADYFKGLGVMVEEWDNPVDTEAAKAWSTTYYGWNIMFQKIVKKWCDEKGLDFDKVYTEANESYNQGYKELGMDNVTRPVLKDVEGPIGGHCVIQNLSLIPDNEVTKFIQNYDEELKMSKMQKDSRESGE